MTGGREVTWDHKDYTVWRQVGGNKVPVADMGTKHLRRSITSLDRQVSVMQRSTDPDESLLDKIANRSKWSIVLRTELERRRMARIDLTAVPFPHLTDLMDQFGEIPHRLSLAQAFMVARVAYVDGIDEMPGVPAFMRDVRSDIDDLMERSELLIDAARDEVERRIVPILESLGKHITVAAIRAGTFEDYNDLDQYVTEE